MTPPPATDDHDGTSGLDPALLEIVRCPRCRGELVVAASSLDCTACSLRYPVRGGVPVLLLDDAQPLS